MSNQDRLAMSRIMKDTHECLQNPPPGISIMAPSEYTSYVWVARIDGPLGTYWEGAKLYMLIVFSKEYPMRAPKVTFIGETPFHANVYIGKKNRGEICATVLQKDWSAAYSIGTLLTALRSLLSSPNPDSPANVEASKMMTNDLPSYRRRVMDCVANSRLIRDRDLLPAINDALSKCKPKVDPLVYKDPVPEPDVERPEEVGMTDEEKTCRAVDRYIEDSNAELRQMAAADPNFEWNDELEAQRMAGVPELKKDLLASGFRAT